MVRNDPQFRIRLPIETKRWVEECARVERRTLNAQIVYCLEKLRFLMDGNKSDAAASQSSQV